MTVPYQHGLLDALMRGMGAIRGRAGRMTKDHRRYLPIAVVVLVSLMITGIAFGAIRVWETRQVELAFSEAARDRVLVLEREIGHTLAVVHDVAVFFEASSIVGRREFRRFVDPTLQRHAYIKSLEWIPIVTGAERDAFVTAARRSFPPFEITERDGGGGLVEAGDRAEYLPVLYVQPYQDNRERLGLDMVSDPVAFQALTAARVSEGTRLSTPVRLGAGDWGFVVSVPVYRRPPHRDLDDVAETEELPRGEMRGFALGVFRMAGVVERALDTLSPAGIDIDVYGLAAGADGTLLYEHVSRLRDGPSPGGSPSPDESGPGRRDARVLNVADHQFRVVSKAVPGLYEPARWSSTMALGGGLAFTMLLTIYLISLVTRNERVRSLVDERTAQLTDAVNALSSEIGDRRHAEQQLQMLNDTLELRVAARTAEAERRAQELEQFAYVTSHDLKAPLRAIENLASWIEEDLQETLEDATREQLNLLKDRVLRMQGLIEGLLEYSRLGQTEGSIGEVDSGALLKEVIDSLSPPVGFTVHVAPGMPVFRTDRLQLSQVFANLISNGLKHHGGASGNIWVDVRESGKFFQFSVRDDGPGIAPEYHEKVFRMFQTLETRDTGTNTGIGLALVRKIVQEQGGSITLDSAPGKGATFRFTWPRGG